MEILAMSDLHGYLPNVSGSYDMMLISGDIVPLEFQTNIFLSYTWLLQAFKPWCDEVDVEHVVVTPGNHDFIFERMPDMRTIGDNIHILINRKISLKGKTIYGCPYTTMDTWAFKKRKYHTYKRMIPNGVDILLCHQPPLYGGLGMVEFGNGDIKELGSQNLTDRIAEVQPELVICGHIHTGNHHDVYMGDKTRLYNTSILDEQYRFRFYPKKIIL